MVSCLMGDSTALASAIVRCCLRITQAGAKCYNDTTLSYGWGKDRRDEVKFYSWYTDEELK